MADDRTGSTNNEKMQISGGGSLSVSERDALTDVLLGRVRDRITGSASSDEIIEGMFLRAAIGVASNLPEDGTLVSDAAIDRAIVAEVAKRDAAVAKAVSKEAKARKAAIAAEALARDALAAATVPVGGIIMWSGDQTTLSKNWVLCDGQHGSPDLRNRFIVGAGDDYAFGQTGGAVRHKTSIEGAHSHSVGISVRGHTLTVSELPEHTHFAAAQIMNHGGNNIDLSQEVAQIARSVQWSGPGRSINNEDYVLAGTNAAATTGTTSGSGGSGAHSHAASGSIKIAGTHRHITDVRPPYYALAFIMRLR